MSNRSSGYKRLRIERQKLDSNQLRVGRLVQHHRLADSLIWREALVVCAIAISDVTEVPFEVDR